MASDRELFELRNGRVIMDEDLSEKMYIIKSYHPEKADETSSGFEWSEMGMANLFGMLYNREARYCTEHKNCVCDNGLPNIVDARLTEILVRDKVKSCRFESNSAGRRVAEKIQEEVKKKGGITHITTKFTTANKETKIIVNSAWVKEHCLFKDASLYQRKSDYGKMMDMLCSYTMAGKNKHDDVPDGMAMLAEFAQSLGGQNVEVFKRPW